MTHTQKLIARIKALAEQQGKSPATVAGAILGSGQALANLEAGKTITLAKFEKACEALDRLERDAVAAHAVIPATREAQDHVG